jgi:hypothetical protein
MTHPDHRHIPFPLDAITGITADRHSDDPQRTLRQNDVHPVAATRHRSAPLSATERRRSARPLPGVAGAVPARYGAMNGTSG